MNAAQLGQLGRIHSPGDIESAVRDLERAGIANFNLDLMYALPGQTTAQSLADLRQALALGPAHLSHYQLMLEPGTAFFHRPPSLPDDDAALEIQLACQAALATAIQWASTLLNPPGVYGTKTGTYTLNEDCTFTMEINGYDASGNLVRYTEWQIVLVDNGKEMRGISLKLLFSPNPPAPPWLDLEPVLTMTGTPTRGKGEGR